MQALNALNDKSRFCMRNEIYEHAIDIKSPVFDAMTDEQKRHTLLMLSFMMSDECIAKARLKFAQALKGEGLDPTADRYKLYMRTSLDNSFDLSPDSYKDFYANHLDDVKKVRASLGLSLDYGSFDVMKTADKYLPHRP
jgi:hypothetical protein